MSARRISKHPPLVYHRAAVTHLAQIVPLVTALALLAATMSLLVAVLALAIAEVSLIAVIPRSRLFRDSIDRRLVRDAQAAAMISRTALFARMGEHHASEFSEIERLAAEIQTRCAVESTEPPEALVERSLLVDRLLLAYVRVAIAHRRSAEAFSLERWAALETQFARGPALTVLDGSCACDWLTRQRLVLAKRRTTWMRARDEREAMSYALATLANVIRWMNEVCAAGANERAREEIDALLASSTAALADLPRFGEDVAVDTSFLGLAAEASSSEPPASGVLVRVASRVSSLEMPTV